MVLDGDAVDVVIECVRRNSAGSVDNKGASAELYWILADNPTIKPTLDSPGVTTFAADPVRKLHYALEKSVEDHAFATTFQAALERARAEHISSLQLSPVRQNVDISGTASGHVNVVQAGRDIRAGHIGDVVKNFYHDRQRKVLAGVLSLAITVVILIAFFIYQTKSSMSSSPQPSDTVTSATISIASVKPFGSTLFSSRDPDIPVTANGRVMVATNEDAGYDKKLTTFDLASGEIIGGVTLPDSTDQRCEFSMVEGGESRDLVVSFEKFSTAAKGTDPAIESQHLIARDARTGSEVWRAGPQTESPAPQPSNRVASCLGALKSRSVTSDGKYAWISFSNPGENFVVNLSTGALRKQEGALVVGDSIAIFRSSGTRFSGHTYIDLVDPSTGQPVNQIDDPALVELIKNKLGQQELVSFDGKTAISSTFYEGELTAWDLPDGKVRWQKHSNGSAFPSAVSGDTVVEYGSGLSGRSTTSGEPLWNDPTVSAFCGEYNGKLYVLANSQFAVLDYTGRQLDYDPDLHECPRILSGAMVHKGVIKKL